jgi:hypothetical protein
MMRSAHQLRVLAGLHLIEDVAARRAEFRKGLAALAARQRSAESAPLEGLSPDQLAASTQAALESELYDDLDFLEPASASAALYAVATALPLGAERRELGRRVLTAMQDGTADTFVRVARLVALDSTKAAEGVHMRARIALVHALPFGASVKPDSLSTVLVARRDLAEHYVVTASRGALWDRVLASSILERAARDGVKRGAGRHAELRTVFEGEGVRAALERLVLDREPLVWHRAASARGLISTFSTPYAEDVERDLASEGSVSRMRRGAASLSAQLPVHGASVVARVEKLLAGPSAERDPGLASAFLHGTVAICALAPETCATLHALAIERGGREAAEALAQLSREVVSEHIAPSVRSAARVVLQRAHGKRSDDEGHNVHLELVCEELSDGRGARPDSLLDLRERALTAFVREGARAASAVAREALELSESLVDELTRCAERPDAAARRTEYRLVHALDGAWLESSTFADLLALTAQHGDSTTEGLRTALLLKRLATTVLRSESAPHLGGEQVPHMTLRMRRLRTLLHALDTDIRHDGEKSQVARESRMRKTAVLCRRVERDESSAMDRIVHAGLARAVESLVRDEAFEASDVLLCYARYVPTAHGVLALADASMLPEVRGMLRLLARLMRALELGGPLAQLRHETLQSLGALVRMLPAEGAPRTESVRICLARLHDALDRIATAPGLTSLVGPDEPLFALADAVDELGRLTAGVNARLGLTAGGVQCTSGHGVRTFASAAERAVELDSRAGLEVTWEALAYALQAELPRPFAELVKHILRAVLLTPTEAAEPRAQAECTFGRQVPLPTWLPAGRFIGDFQVQRALGQQPGVYELEVVPSPMRFDPTAERFILTVPAYDGHVARALSESEYTAAFIRDAETLLALPTHPNLAGVIAFDARNPAFPHFVTVRVEGSSLARLVARGQLTTERALGLMAGVLSGLAAMHGVGVGHLGLRPEQVILRKGEPRGGAEQPVITGFGLSGRHVRLGCAYAPYGAPEVWRLSGDADLFQPHLVDVYAFGCLAYELLMGERLFDGATDAACIAEHVSHDGMPHRIAVLAQNSATRPLAEWLSTCLRRKSEDRASVEDLLATLQALRPLSRLPWPVASAPPGPPD